MVSDKYLYLLIFALNIYYPIFLLLNDYLGIYPYPHSIEIISFLFLTNFAILLLYFTPSIKVRRLPTIQFNYPLFIVFPFCFLAIINAPWYLDREGIDASISSIGRAIWMIYVWTNFRNFNTSKRLVLLCLTLLLGGIDGSRTYPLMTMIPLIIPNKFSLPRITLGLIFIIVATSLIHFARINTIEELDLNFDSLIFAALIGESYWGSYGLSQIHQIGSPIFFQETLATLTYPIIGFLYLAYDPYLVDAHTILAVQDGLTEKYFPMGGYNIHVQFSRYSFFGIFLFYLYILILRESIKILIPIRDFNFSLIFVFLSIKAAPSLLLNMVYYVCIISYLIHFFRLRRIIF